MSIQSMIGSPHPSGRLRVTTKEYRKWLRWLRLLLFVASSVSIILTYQGLFMVIGERWLAMALSGFVGLVCWVICAFLLEYFSRGNEDERSFLLRNVAVPVAGITCITSTLFAALSMASPQAIKLELQRRTDEADALAVKRLQEHKQEARALEILRAQGKEFARLAVEEVEGGRFGGTAGDGKISNDLAAIGRGFMAATAAIETAQERKQEAGKAAMKAVEGMRATVENAQANAASIHAAQSEYTQHLRAFEMAMGELRESSLPGDVLAPVDAALEVQKASPFTAQQKNLAKQQEGAATVESLAQSARSKTQTALNEIRIEADERRPIQKPEPMEAVLEHWGEVAYLGAFPLVLDLGAPLLAMACLMFLGARLVSEPEARTEQEFESDLEQVHPHVIQNDGAGAVSAGAARGSGGPQWQAYLEKRKAAQEDRHQGSDQGRPAKATHEPSGQRREVGFVSAKRAGTSQAEGQGTPTMAGGGSEVRMAVGDLAGSYPKDASGGWARAAAPDLREYAPPQVETQEAETGARSRPTRLRTVTETGPTSDPCRTCQNRPE